jgi:hypothetical protein
MRIKRIICVYVMLCAADISYSQSMMYLWKQELAIGNGSFEENWTSGKFPMGITPIIAFDDKLYMVGNRKTWISVDGINWNAHDKTSWGERYGMTVTYFNGELWAIGGMKSWGKFYNDIWASIDGITWRLVTPKADWTERRGHAIVVYDNKMWLMGGSKSSGQPNKPPTESFNDVWSSQDGRNWTLLVRNADWSGREPQVVVFNNKFYLVGDTNKSDIWTSNDGEKWMLLKDIAEWRPRQNYGLLVYDNKLWVFGGRGLNDVWNSNDGEVWKKQHNAPWTTRTTSQCVVYLNKIWIYSGKTGRVDSWEGDIWTLKKVN